ncbi:FHA domain-containing protein [Ditylenchus destructor]|nr:FHA domain-containing protein [Ditylenchus destructor]
MSSKGDSSRRDNRERHRRSPSPPRRRRSRSRSDERREKRRPRPARDSRDRSRSPPPRKRSEDRDPNKDRPRGSRREDNKRDVKNEAESPEKWGKRDTEWGKRPTDDGKADIPEKDKEKPSFEPSGKLAEDTNTYKGIVIKYNEPPEAKLPKIRWRLYPFKGEADLPVVYIHRQSAYLIGRDRKIADFPTDHPSCSKQHAVLQYRFVLCLFVIISLTYERSDGSRGRRTRPYIIDLKSGNGTYLNGARIDAQRYYELKEKDILKFGFSSREYVVLNEMSLEGEEDEQSDEEKVDIDATGAEEKMKDEDDELF